MPAPDFFSLEVNLSPIVTQKLRPARHPRTFLLLLYQCQFEIFPSKTSLLPSISQVTMSYLVPVRLNNEGAELLSRGRIKDGRAHLITALNLAKSATVGHQQQQSDDSAFRSLKQSDSSGSDDIIKYQWLNRMNHIQEVGTVETFVFERPIQILEHPSLENPPSLAFVTDISCAIIFNIALSLHAEFLATMNSNLLIEAIKSYKIVFGMRGARARKDMQGSNRNALLDLALFNNLGHVHVEQSDFNKAAKYFRNMLRFLHLSQRDINVEDFVGFVTGARWQPPVCAPAA
jgi:hypothetical protein